jgi:Protein of unknown function (DUF4199)
LPANAARDLMGRRSQLAGIPVIRLIALYGTIAGLIVAIPMVWLMLTLSPGEAPAGVVYGYLTMIVALTAVFLGVKHYRDKALGGAIKFGPALLVGLGISAVASVIYAIGWEISLAWSGFDFAESYSTAMVEARRAQGASEAELQKAIADAESFVKMYDNPLYRVPITFIEMFPVGVLISLISAALLRNSRFLPARTGAA